MTRKSFPLKRCPVCWGLMERKRYGDRREKPVEYARRETCGPRCRGIQQQSEKVTNARRRCLQCRFEIERKRYPCGRQETPARFLRRRWCDIECMREWLKDPKHKALTGTWRWQGRRRAMRERKKDRIATKATRMLPRGVAPRRGRPPLNMPPACFHGERGDCIYCDRLNEIAAAQARLRVTRRNVAA